jgi:hypothetical protein
MPWKKANYPKEWPAIRKAIQERAGDRCEWCGVPNHLIIVRNKVHPVQWLPWEDSLETLDAEARDEWGKPVVIVCTVAHVHDPSPANVSPKNLAFLCQRCHLNLDREHHLAVQKRNRERRKGQLPLLDVPFPGEYRGR